MRTLYELLATIFILPQKCSQIVAIVEYLGSIYPLCTYSEKKNVYKRKVS